MNQLQQLNAPYRSGFLLKHDLDLFSFAYIFFLSDDAYPAHDRELSIPFGRKNRKLKNVYDGSTISLTDNLLYVRVE